MGAADAPIFAAGNPDTPWWSGSNLVSTSAPVPEEHYEAEQGEGAGEERHALEPVPECPAVVRKDHFSRRLGIPSHPHPDPRSTGGITSGKLLCEADCSPDRPIVTSESSAP